MSRSEISRTENAPPVTLGEGNTPLIAARRIRCDRGVKLFFKLESTNPSGSYKDRFIAAEMARVLAGGSRVCLATSSGNTGSSLAAYCARYGVACVVVVNEEVPAGKLAQMQAHGARILRVAGFAASPSVTARVFEDLKSLSARHNVPLVVSAYRYCPAGMRGVQSIARELLAQFGGAPPRHVFVPVGGGGLFSAVARGFLSSGAAMPRIHAVQPAGCLTVVAGYQRGDAEIRPVTSTTRVSGLAVPFDIDASLALGLLRECGGRGFSVTDEEVFQAQRLLLEQEGIYCEPAGATALAGYLQALAGGVVQPEEASVCLVTGSGFKDSESILRVAEKFPARFLEAEEVVAAVEELA